MNGLFSDQELVNLAIETGVLNAADGGKGPAADKAINFARTLMMVAGALQKTAPKDITNLFNPEETSTHTHLGLTPAHNTIGAIQDDPKISGPKPDSKVDLFI